MSRDTFQYSLSIILEQTSSNKNLHETTLPAKNLINAFLFQGFWWLIILNVSWGRPWVAMALLPIYMTLHLRFISSSPREELLYLCSVAVMGYAMDVLFSFAGGFIFSSSSAPPLWLFVIWILFASTLRHSLNWLMGRPFLTAFFFFVGGPISYYAVAQFGLLHYTEPVEITLLLHGGLWALEGIFFYKLQTLFFPTHPQEDRP